MSPAAVLAARKRHQAAHQGLRSGSVTISGVTYSAAVVLSPVQNVPKEDGSGWEKMQTITVRVLKSLLAATPGKRTVLTHNSADYLITAIGGQSSNEPAWRIQGTRRSPVAA